MANALDEILDKVQREMDDVQSTEARKPECARKRLSVEERTIVPGQTFAPVHALRQHASSELCVLCDLTAKIDVSDATLQRLPKKLLSATAIRTMDKFKTTHWCEHCRVPLHPECWFFWHYASLLAPGEPLRNRAASRYVMQRRVDYESDLGRNIKAAQLAAPRDTGLDEYPGHERDFDRIFAFLQTRMQRVPVATALKGGVLVVGPAPFKRELQEWDGATERGPSDDAEAGARACLWTAERRYYKRDEDGGELAHAWVSGDGVAARELSNAPPPRGHRCRLCDISAQLWGDAAMLKYKDGAPGYRLTHGYCEDCKVFLHKDCHARWHSAWAPVSAIMVRRDASAQKERVSGVVQYLAVALLGGGQRALPSGGSIPTEFAALPGSSVRLHASGHEKLRLIAAGGREEDEEEGGGRGGGGKASCMLCMLTFSAQRGRKEGDKLPVSGLEDSLQTVHECPTCNVALHPACSTFWHSEIVPFSRRILASVVT